MVLAQKAQAAVADDIPAPLLHPLQDDGDACAQAGEYALQYMDAYFAAHDTASNYLSESECAISCSFLAPQVLHQAAHYAVLRYLKRAERQDV